MSYHTRFEHFHPKVLDATDKLFRSRPWAGTGDELDAKYRRWLERASDTYQVEVPAFVIVPPEECYGSGCYRPAVQTIFLPKHSVMSLLHEYRHHLQFENPLLIAKRVNRDVSEDDARAWSHSLLYQVRPEWYERSLTTGRFFHGNPV